MLLQLEILQRLVGDYLIELVEEYQELLEEFLDLQEQ